MSDLLAAERHFAFGENWTDFVNVVDDERVSQAVESMKRLFPNDELRAKTFLDIGCGSGLSSLAAARLGVASVSAIDIDPSSASATCQLLTRRGGATPWTAQVLSVFDLPPIQFDVVYSWGVLHHTGAMWRAIEAACGRVRPGGVFAIALYRKTPLCTAWKVEKLLYTKSPDWIRAPWRWGFMAANLFALTVARRQNPVKFIREYKLKRGMSFRHDMHDWLGGYPYESVAPAEVRGFMAARGFSEVRAFTKKSPAFGLFGSGCDEYVFQKAGSLRNCR
jgi:2-polyprenyl-6-hydroxyphenyl methylase/3-demethylubiquinone-9 3-methyltransferase